MMQDGLSSKELKDWLEKHPETNFKGVQYLAKNISIVNDKLIKYTVKKLD